MVLQHDREHKEAQNCTANPMVASTRGLASWNDDGERREGLRAPAVSNVDAAVDTLHDKIRKSPEHVRGDKGKRERQKGAAGNNYGGRDLRKTAAEVSNSGDEVQRPRGLTRRGTKGKKERGSGAIRGWKRGNK